MFRISRNTFITSLIAVLLMAATLNANAISVFSIGGSVKDENGTPVADGTAVTLTNETRNLTLTVKVGEGSKSGVYTAIFATISIIEDRREGFLQSVLVAPIPRWSMVLGKILGGTLIALFQGLIFLLLALTINVHLDFVSLIQLVGLVFVAGLALTSLGFVIAWRMESTQGFHAIMSVLLMPMWLLSGAFFPVPPATDVNVVQSVMHWGMRLNPMTYCVGGIRRLLYGQLDDKVFYYTPGLAICWLVTIVFAILMFAAACKTSARRTTGDLL
ncbi:MAG: ABC transporter permease [Planctomycetes bacterium]|nr:ABC transporter permease [Planctomycetota bacterium]